MSRLADVALVVHVAVGVVALGAGLGALLTAKGSRPHRRSGRAYVYSIGVVGATGVVLSTVRWSPFLLLVSVFAIYLAFTGYRALAQTTTDRPAAIDWAAVGVTLCTCVAVAGSVLGGHHGWLVAGAGMPALVPLALAASCAYLPLWDALSFRRGPPGASAGLIEHLVRMVASYAVTVATVSVTNLTHLPVAVRAIWPAVIFVPLLVFWIHTYGRTPPRGPRRPDGYDG